MQWNDYTGGPLPREATHVQLANGDVVDASHVIAGEGGILRYYGPALVVASAEPATVPPILPEHYETVATAALHALLAGQSITLTHPEGFARCGLALPLVRHEGNSRTYRPIAILDWINDQTAKAY
jgi:hypothetical protein